MNNVILNGNLVKQIRDGENLGSIADYVKDILYRKGPTETIVLEILSYLKLFQPDFFQEIEPEIIETMGLFFKNSNPETIQGVIFDMYHQYIKEVYGEDFTPVQADILKQIKEKQYFSFSAPTSTGKSFVFRDLIQSSSQDVAVIVPSRALINEYYDRINDLINVKEVNVLTFVDRINTKHAKRNVFILTPERARDLFKNKSWLNLDLILFDEAQLSDEDSVRGLYFDSIVRRALKSFPTAKYLFAHPFISNPESQIKKNAIAENNSYSRNYQQKNVGQLFYVFDSTTNKYYHLGTDKKLMGMQRVESTFDPVEKAILNDGSVLIYVAKTHIYNKSVFTQFKKYIDICERISDPDALEMIEELRNYIGASNRVAHFYNSEMLEKLSYGIVVHHGSMPLTARLILEHFTQKGFCRICFATSTLEQGINMPFDVVYLDRFEASKSLSVKNLIGRAGRSTTEKKFDFGSVVVMNSAATSLRDTLKKEEYISEISHLDEPDDSLDDTYKDFKEAIKNDEFSDEYNLTNKELEKLKTDDFTMIVSELLDIMFDDDDHLMVNEDSNMKEIYDDFHILYELHLGRKLNAGEKSVLSNAIKIMIWKAYGRTFSSICQRRYAYAARVSERRDLEKQDKFAEAKNLPVQYICGYHDIPDKTLNNFPLFPAATKAEDVDYDLVVYDTYDYLDKLIGFRLSDMFYALFHQFFISKSNNRALKLAKYFKYGTDKEREIWMLRYGLTFEDIEWVKPCINAIDETEIKFNDNIKSLDENQRNVIEKFLYE